MSGAVQSLESKHRISSSGWGWTDGGSRKEQCHHASQQKLPASWNGVAKRNLKDLLRCVKHQGMCLKEWLWKMIAQAEFLGDGL